MNPYNEGALLEGMFKQRIETINAFHERGMVPRIDVKLMDTPNYQTFLKKLVSWMTAELGEVSMENAGALELYLTKGPQECMEELIGYSRKSAYELMDVMQFILEFMVYIDVTAADINAYYSALLKERNLELAYQTDGLSSAMNYARHTNIWDDKVREIAFASKIAVPEISMGVHHMLISEDMDFFKEMCMWDTVKAFNKACRFLKSKEWSTNQPEVPEGEFKRQVMIGWLYFCKLLDLHGLEPKFIYYYFDKTTKKINERLHNGY